jgi:hypothetical protein
MPHKSTQGAIMKYMLFVCALLTTLCGFSSFASGYAIKLIPQNIDTYVYEMAHQPTFEQSLSARGSDYIEVHSYSHNYDQLVRFGSSVKSYTQKSYHNNKIITKSLISFNTWAYSEQDSFFETNHYFDCYYKLNISPEFPDYNDNNSVSLTSNTMPKYYSLGALKLYDDSSNVVYHNDDYIGFIDNQITLDKDYILNIEYYINHLTYDNVDIRDTLAFSLVENKPVPEPSSWLLFSIGLLALAGIRQKNILSR